MMGFHPEMSWLLGLQIVNGLAQATGWSGLSRIFRSSFPSESRGITIGWWSTCYAAGSLLATMVATFAPTAPWLQRLGWRRAMLLPSILMLATNLLFIRVFGVRASR
jgi:sugar phosphate permease